jgi:hypothetical protein
MNIIQLQDNLKNLSDQQLAQAMQMPAQDTPPFLVVSELNRRKKMRDNFQAQQASQNQTTVAQDVVAAAGVPQQAASEMAQSLAPQTDMTNNTGIMSVPQEASPMQAMASGGVIKLQTGTDAERRAEIKRRQLSFGNAVDDTIGAAKNAADFYFLGLPLAGIESVASGLGDAAAYGVSLVPGAEDLSMGISDLAKQSADNAQTFYNEGVFPDYYRYEPTMPSDPRVDGAPAADPKAQAAVTTAKDAIAAKAAVEEQAAADKKGGSGGSGGAGGAAKPSTYEQMLMDALANADKKAKQDKWMALAQMGLAMMSSQSPTLLGAIGEAGAASLPLYQQARDTAEASKLEAAKGLYDIAMQRQARNDALAAAGAKAKGSGLSAKQTFDVAKQAVDAAAARLTTLGIDPNMDPNDPKIPPTIRVAAAQALNDFNAAYGDYRSLFATLNSEGISTVDPTAELDVAE